MINKVILVGNVGADPEIKTLESGAKYARIRLATTERIYTKEKNETKEQTEWHNITLWRPCRCRSTTQRLPGYIRVRYAHVSTPKMGLSATPRRLLATS